MRLLRRFPAPPLAIPEAMRVLLIPEVYRKSATACGTLNDAVSWVDEWLGYDRGLHVYWLLPPREMSDYDRQYVRADRDRVTLLEAERLVGDHQYGDKFVESGHSQDEFEALEAGIYHRLGYVDLVVDQRLTGRFDLYKWLLEHGGHREAAVTPVQIIGYVHDLRLPFKRHGREYPKEAAVKRELLAGVMTDGLWFKAGVDANRMREYGEAYLQGQIIDRLLTEAIQTGSPLDFEDYEESYSDEPRVLHIAGSGWGKKNLDVVLSLGRRLFQRYGIRTVMTNMDPIPEPFANREFVDPYPEASRQTFEWELKRGDIAVCASDHETMARTSFEQAASGQVLVLRDRPWVYDCVPPEHPLIGDPEDLWSLIVRVVKHWPRAVSANRRLVDHLRTVRGPQACGRRTYEDLRERVSDRIHEFDHCDKSGKEPVEAALADGNDGVRLDTLNRRTADYTVGGDPVLSGEFTVTDLVYTLRSFGYRDTGCSGTPVFEVADGNLPPDTIERTGTVHTKTG